MKHFLSFATGLAVGALAAAREHREHKASERLGAAALETLLNAIDANDAETGAHVRRVALYAGILAGTIELDAHARRTIERVALFHDIGKIHEALFDILREDDHLTPEERRAIASHPERGARVLEPLRAFYPDLADGVLAHHERWDGRGYPRGLAGEAIPLAARIVALADTFDVITHGRRYQPGRTVTDAAETIAEGRGQQFDPALVDVLLRTPVLEQLESARSKAMQPARRSERRTGEHQDAPDVRFRWRPAGAEQPSPDPPR